MQPLSRERQYCAAEAFARKIGRAKENVIAGVGSDEILRILTDVFLNHNDFAVAYVPTFSMYKYFTEIAKGNFIPVHSKSDDLMPDVEGLIAVANQYRAKLIFICTPNNPTGYLWPKEDLIKIIRQTNSMVIVDEAYIDFAESDNLDLIDLSDRVIILRTLSKAFGLAGVRVGCAIAQKETANYLNMAKVPYNLSTVAQKLAELILRHGDLVQAQVEKIKTERDRMVSVLEQYDDVRVFPTAANFVFLTPPKYDEIMQSADAQSVSLRYLGNETEHAIRITVGSAEENDRVLKIFSEVFS